jgi:alcohol dehydrogenase (cytochrome c)
VVLPGTLGGVETPMALANGVVYCPVINLPTEYSSTALVGFDFTGGTSEMVALDLATGEQLWSAEVQAPLYGGATVAGDIVFSAGIDGVVRGWNTADGTLVWTWQTTGVNGSPAIVGDMMFVPAGGLFVPSGDTVETDAANQVAGVYALKLGLGTGDSATPMASPSA